MKHTKYYAHSLEGCPPNEWQLLSDHLESVATLAERFASAFASQDWARNAGLLHDVGKADDAFQAYLFRENGLDDAEYDTAGLSRVNHSSAGAALAEEDLGFPFGRVLAYLVAGHHAGLPDYDPADTGHAALCMRLEEGKKNLKRIREFSSSIMPQLEHQLRCPAYISPENTHLWIRLLFSCLVLAFLRSSFADSFMGVVSFIPSASFSASPEGFFFSTCRPPCKVNRTILRICASLILWESLLTRLIAFNKAVINQMSRWASQSSGYVGVRPSQNSRGMVGNVPRSSSTLPINFFLASYL